MPPTAADTAANAAANFAAMLNAFAQGAVPTPATGADPADVGFDLWILAGQSNMSGRGLGFDLTALDPPNPRVWQYGFSGTYAERVSLALTPLAMHDTASGLSPAIAFAGELVKTMPDNRNVLLVCAAQGASGFQPNASGQTWDPSLNAAADLDLARSMVAQTRRALASAGPNARVAGVLWHQGENDSNSTAYATNTYAGKLDALITWTREQLGLPGLPWLLGQMNPDGIAVQPIKAIVDAKTQDTVRRLTRVGYALGPSGASNTGDTTHYSAVGARALGLSYFRHALRLAKANGLGTAPATPTGLAFVQTASALVVTIHRGTGRYTALRLRYRSSGSSGAWTEVDAATSPQVSLTGLAAGSYEVQATSVNEQGTAAWSSSSTAVVVGAPGAASALAVSAVTSSGAALSWTAGDQATSYRVEISTDSGATWQAYSTFTGTTATLTGLAASTAYRVRVVALNVIGEAAASAMVGFSTAASPALIDTAGVSALAAYGIRRLRSAYAGKAMKVRRSSDNTTADVGFVANGSLDTSALMDFVGSASAYVATLYDQSGNGKDLVQATAAAQPRIVNAGVMDAQMVLDGVDDFMSAGVVGLYGVAGFSACFVLRNIADASYTTAGRFLGETSSTSTVPAYAFGWTQTAGGSLAALIRNDANVQLTPTFTGSSFTPANALGYFTLEDSGAAPSVVSARGAGAQAVSGSYTRSGTLTLDTFTLGCLNRSGAQANFQHGALAELVIFPKLTDDQRALVEANQKARYGL